MDDRRDRPAMEIQIFDIFIFSTVFYLPIEKRSHSIIVVEQHIEGMAVAVN